jgi:hypothetical protein
MSDQSEMSVRRAVGLGLFSTAWAVLALAAWDGFHPDWSRIPFHALGTGVVTGLFVYFGDDDEPESGTPGRFDVLFTAAPYVVFAALLVWALSDDELPNFAIFLLTISGAMIVGHVAGRVLRRRRERDSLGL